MARVNIFLVAAALVVGMVVVGMVGYDGTRDVYNPHPSENLEIRTWYDLDAVRYNLAGNHTLMNDLDSTTAGYTELASPTANEERGWQPIDKQRVLISDFGDSMSVVFKGTFDGQGYEIHDLFINRPGKDNVGLFGFSYGIIKDIGLVNVTVTGDEYVGCLVGSNGGTVSNSYSTGSVTGNSYIGGLVGENERSRDNKRGMVNNSFYSYDEVLINGENTITIGALFDKDFEEWLANDKFLDVNDRLSQENGYYLINDVNDFKELLAFGQDDSLKFRLTNDLDLAIEPNLYIPYFAGEFDGNGHKISNLSFDFDFVSPVGLFGYLAPGGKVTQVGVENVNITGAENVGGLVGFNDGTVSNCYATGSVTGLMWVGGLVGESYGTVSNSYFTGSVSGDQSVGGLLGRNWDRATLSNSYSTGSVSGGSYVGGLVGENGGLWKQEGDVSNSYSTSSVSGDEYVGGLVGLNDGPVSNCYHTTGSVSGVSKVGGLVGQNEKTVSSCYATGSVSGKVEVGGLMGENYHGTVSDSHATGNVSGENYVGGLVGLNKDIVDNCYATGSVTGIWPVGGLVGRNNGGVSNSYSTGNVTGNWYVGGLLGDGGHPITPVNNCYATGSVTGNKYVGGLVGFHLEGTVSNCYATGSVRGKSYVGGLVGENYAGTVNKCYSTGSVAGSEIIGGLVGDNYEEGTVSNSFSTGSVTGDEDVGGLVGYSSGTVSSSFWDTQTSGQATSDGGTGKTTAKMQDITTFSGSGWNIIAVGSSGERNPAYIWNIVDDATYPFLYWEP
jgi:hypothetical protein